MKLTHTIYGPPIYTYTTNIVLQVLKMALPAKYHEGTRLLESQIELLTGRAEEISTFLLSVEEIQQDVS